MSAKDSIHLFQSIVSLSDQQLKSILEVTTSKQCSIIANAVRNLMHNKSIIISDKDKKFLQKHIQLVQQLASKLICSSDKRQLFTDNYKIIRRIANIVLQHLT